MSAVDVRAALSTVPRDMLAQRRLLDFAQLAGLLERVECGDIRRLAISAPPGHGKSVLLQTFVAWFLGRKPKRRILQISASESLVKRNSRDVQALVRGDAWP